MTLRTANRRRLKKRRGHPLDRPRPLTGFPFSAAYWIVAEIDRRIAELQA